MAVKLAHAMGAEVTVLSQSLKQAGGRAAPRRRPLLRDQRPGDVRGAAPARFDLIINTVSAPLDLDAYLRPARARRHDGQRRRPAGAAADPGLQPVQQPPLASPAPGIGGIRETQEMLDFCAEHGIAAEIEVIPAEQINEAYERVLDSDVRYRFVIDTASLV